MNRRSFWKRWFTGAFAACACSTGMLFAQNSYPPPPSGTSALQPLPYAPSSPTGAPSAQAVTSPVPLPATLPPQLPMERAAPKNVSVPAAPAAATIQFPAPPTPPATQSPSGAPAAVIAPVGVPARPVQGGKEGTPEPIPAPAPTPAPVEAAPASEAPVAVGQHKRHGLRGCASCGGGGCSSCGNGVTCGPTAGCIGCGPGMRCYPGRNPCCECDHDTCLGRVWCGLYHCICCPDPCYEGVFIAEANSAFWVDSARPVTQTRLRLDLGYGFQFPDRNEFFWARTGGGAGKGPALIERRLSYAEFSLAQEIATKNASFTIETPYRSTDPLVNPDSSGFGDMSLTAKTLLLDCELLQIATQFRTYLPVGQSRKGLGTGHVSLEPSLLVTMKLLPETYFQGQVAEWIPIAGDSAYAGAVLHYHAAINHVMFRFMPDVLLIGSAEFTGYSFQDGLYSDPILMRGQTSSGQSYFYAGPSLRVSICNRVDFGGSALYNLDGGGPEQIYRMEMRLRF